MLNLIALQLDKEGIKGREDDERGGGGAVIRGQRLCQVFLSKGGDYLREAIIREMVIIRRNTLFQASSNLLFPVVATFDFQNRG